MVQSCCFVGCGKQASFQIVAHRIDGRCAGPDPYSDDTFACVDHVGALLGWQPNAVDTEEIQWTVTQWDEVNLSPLMVSTTDER